MNRTSTNSQTRAAPVRQQNNSDLALELYDEDKQPAGLLHAWASVEVPVSSTVAPTLPSRTCVASSCCRTYWARAPPRGIVRPTGTQSESVRVGAMRARAVRGSVRCGARVGCARRYVFDFAAISYAEIMYSY